MLGQLVKRFETKLRLNSNIPPTPPKTSSPLSSHLTTNLETIKERYHNSSDLIIKQIKVGNIDVGFIMVEAMVNLQLVSLNYLDPLTQYDEKDSTPQDVYTFMTDKIPIGINLQEIKTYEDVFQFMMSGFIITLVDGVNHGFGFSAAGFNFRSISEPSTEINIRGSREGFTEVIRINLSMVRRRLKSPNLKFELLQLGTKSKTDVCLLYLTDVVDQKLVDHIKEQLNQIKIDTILDTGYLAPFLEGSPISIFSDIGTTERPDTVCAKLSEGRVGILVDGTPFALIAPYFFIDNFQNFDDYCNQSYYVSYMRLLKYLCFAITILLPGMYVALGTHHPELFPHALLYTIVTSDLTSTFPLFYQAILLGVFAEILREACLRLPTPMGAGIGIVGGLVIGDAAVSAGLVGTPMILIITLTLLTSFVIPKLQEPLTILRFVFILLGGIYGLYGISLGICITCMNLCALKNGPYAYFQPLIPLKANRLNDALTRLSWVRMNHSTKPITTKKDSEKD